MSTAANEIAVRTFYDNVRRGDFSAATCVYADDLSWVEPPFPGHDGGTFRGKENILQNVLGKFMGTWKQLSVTPERITGAGEMVIVHGRYTGQHAGTGRVFESRFVHTWTFGSGKAVRFEMLADTIQMFRTVRPNGPGDIPVAGRTIAVNGLDVFYREAGPRGEPIILLLHGFPSSSHMFRDLIPALADRFHVIAPDYPGFGLSSMPSHKEFGYTFDNLARMVADFTDAIGLEKYAIYMQDYGGPIGMRLATARPERVAGLVVQNANAYLAGLSENLVPLTAYMSNPTPETEAPVRAFLTAGTTQFQWTHGTRHPERIDPAFWVHDQHFLDRPGNAEIQLALFRDYRTNPPLYPTWQEYLRTRRPPTLIAWGKHDPFFTPAGAEAFLRDVPDAELHLLDTGHFALADHVTEIAGLTRKFLTGQAE